MEIALDRAVAGHFLPDEAAWARAHDAERQSRIGQARGAAPSPYAGSLPVSTFAGAVAVASIRRTPEAQADIAAARAVPTAMEVAMQEVERGEMQALGPVTNGVPCSRCGQGIEAGDLEVAAGRHLTCPPLDAALSNAALADTPAVREMGGPVFSEQSAEDLARVHDGWNAIFPIDGPRRGTGTTVIRGSIKASRVSSGNVTLDTTHTVRGLLRSLGGPPHIEIERADLDDAIAALQVLAGTPPPGSHAPVLPPGAVLITGPEAERYRALQAAACAGQAAAAAVQSTSAALRDAFQAFCAGVAPSKEL